MAWPLTLSSASLASLLLTVAVAVIRNSIDWDRQPRPCSIEAVAGDAAARDAYGADAANRGYAVAVGAGAAVAAAAADTALIVVVCLWRLH